MMQQMQKMQESMKNMQSELKTVQVIGESGAGMVKVFMDGRSIVNNIDIDENILKEEKKVLEELITAAVNDAIRKVEEAKQNKMQNLMSGFGLPANFNFPFMPFGDNK